jgi:Arm DNA-binding domain
MPIIKLTKAVVDKLPYPKNGQELYFDSELKGFGLCVGKRAKTYFVQASVDNDRVRHKIGRHNIFTAEMAREEAIKHLGDFARGINPKKKLQMEYANKITLAQAMEEYAIEIKQICITNLLRNQSKYEFR